MPVSASTVFLVGNPSNQRDVLMLNLKSDGFEVSLFSDISDAHLLLNTSRPEVIILDLLAHDPKVFEACRIVKTHPVTKQIQILLLSSSSDSIRNSIKNDCCVDRHIVKPYYVSDVVFQARLLVNCAKPPPPNAILRIGELQVTLEEHRVTHNSNAIHLGPIEFRLLVHLMKRPNYTWTRNELLATVWGGKLPLESNTVEIHIGRLRKAICQFGLRNPIKTVRGAGYRFEEAQ